MIHVGFDGITMPLDNKVVVIHADDGPIEGAGITWEKVNGALSVTVEFKPRGRNAIQISLIEDEHGDYEVVQPPVFIRKPIIEQKED